MNSTQYFPYRNETRNHGWMTWVCCPLWFLERWVLPNFENGECESPNHVQAGFREKHCVSIVSLEFGVGAESAKCIWHSMKIYQQNWKLYFQRLCLMVVYHIVGRNFLFSITLTSNLTLMAGINLNQFFPKKKILIQTQECLHRRKYSEKSRKYPEVSR